MALYGNLKYWEERYTHSGDDGAYDWYQAYGDLRHLLTPEFLNSPYKGMCTPQNRSNEDVALVETYVPSFPPREQCRVLILGSGNSPFGEDMMKDGWTGEIINVDFSPVVIDQMQRKYKKYEKEGNQMGMEFLCADINNGLPFSENSFDLIICKGVFDSILCSSGSVNHIKKFVAECDRVLASGHGCLFLVTHGSPDNRVVFLEHENDPTYFWEGIWIERIPKRNKTVSQNDYVYVCRKKRNTTKEDSVKKEVPLITERIDEENADLGIEPKISKAQE